MMAMDIEKKDPTMTKIKRWGKFIWLYASSLFLPTAIVTERVEKALKQFEEETQREEEEKARRAAEKAKAR
jgi:hypothetical protein